MFIEDNFNIEATYKKMHFLKHLTIKYPLMQSIHNCLYKCQLSTLYSDTPECMSILGPSRSGKSKLVKSYFKKFPDKRTPEGIIKKILYCTVPIPGVRGALGPAMLESLKDPFYKKKQLSADRNFRIIELIKKCKVELIIIDEIQHIVDRNNNRLLRESADWFKYILEQTNVSFVFVGLKESKKIFWGNEQLRARVRNNFNTSAFTYSKEYRAFLYSLDLSLSKMGLKISNLADPDTAKRIYLASQGLIGNIMTLIKEAVFITLQKNQSVLTFDNLFESYENKLTDIYSKNPFDIQFSVSKAMQEFTPLPKIDSELSGPMTNNRINTR